MSGSFEIPIDFDDEVQTPEVIAAEKAALLERMSTEAFLDGPSKFIDELRHPVSDPVRSDADVQAAAELACAELLLSSKALKLTKADEQPQGVTTIQRFFHLPSTRRVDLSLIFPRVAHEVWQCLMNPTESPRVRLEYCVKIQTWLRQHPGQFIHWNTHVDGFPKLSPPNKVVPRPDSRATDKEMISPTPSSKADGSSSGVQKRIPGSRDPYRGTLVHAGVPLNEDPAKTEEALSREAVVSIDDPKDVRALQEAIHKVYPAKRREAALKEVLERVQEKRAKGTEENTLDPTSTKRAQKLREAIKRLGRSEG